jgi:hypothetical protein
MKKTTHSITSEIAEIISKTPLFLLAQMQRAYSLINTPNKQQAILDALPDFEITAAEAVTMYGEFYNLLNDLGFNENLNPPNPDVFQIQEDGTVIYVAPPTDFVVLPEDLEQIE